MIGERKASRSGAQSHRLREASQDHASEQAGSEAEIAPAAEVATTEVATATEVTTT